MQFKLYTEGDFHLLLIVLACGTVLLGLSGCHFCHEEAKSILGFLGAIPILSLYAKNLIARLHARKCIHIKPTLPIKIVGGFEVYNLKHTTPLLSKVERLKTAFLSIRKEQWNSHTMS